MKIRSIAIVKLSSLGDIIHTLPALNLLRSNFQEAKITWFAETSGAELLASFSGIDEIVPVEIKKGGFFNKIVKFWSVVSEYRGNFDVILDFQGLIKSAVFSRLIGKNVIGFNKANLREPLSSLFYREKVTLFNEGRSVIEKNIHLLNLVGISSDNINYPLKELFFSKEIEKFFMENDLKSGKYAILNVGGGWESKLLSIERNVKILSGIDAGIKKLVLWGNGSEEKKADEVVRLSEAIKIPFLTFNDLILLIKYGGVLISADSLPLHIADVTDTRSVGIFGPTNPKRNGSLDKRNLSVVNKIGCSFCYKKSCSHKKCLKGINLSLITDYVNSLLSD